MKVLIMWPSSGVTLHAWQQRMTPALHCAAASLDLCRPIAMASAMALSDSATQLPSARAPWALSAPQQRHGGRHGAVVKDHVHAQSLIPMT